MRPDPATMAGAMAGVAETYDALRLETITAADLQRKVFAPLRFPIPGLVPEGLTLLAGKPKFGKSYLVLDMALAVANGGVALGHIECPAGDVLYCALEDGQRRLQARIAAMLPKSSAFPERLELATSMPRIGEGLETALEQWLEAHPGARLVILDTWRCIKPEATGKRTGYDEDAMGMQALHGIAKAWPGVAFVVVHHTRKMEADDPMDTISGTTGLTGVPDNLMVLGAHGEGARLVSVSREMEGYDKALRRDRDSGGWTIIGDAKLLAATSERQVILEALAGAGDEGMSAGNVADLVDKTQVAVKRSLNRMVTAGEARRVKPGRYACPDSPAVPIPWCDDDERDSGTAGTGENDDD